MKNFFYKVKDKNENTKQGTLQASDITRAAKILENKGYIVLEIKEIEDEKNIVEKKHFRETKSNIILSLNEKKEFFNSFMFLYKSDLAFSEIFKTIMESSQSKNVKNICFELLRRVSAGYTLKESLKQYENSFGKAYSALISAGESSGKLEKILEGINENIKNQEQTKSRISSALIYPSFIFLLAIAVGLFFKLFVFKVFSNFEDCCTSSIINMLIIALVEIVIIFAVMFAIGLFVYKNKKIMAKLQNFIFNIGPMRTLLRYYSFANYFSVLSLSFESGIPFVEGLGLAYSVVGIPAIQVKLKKIANMIETGCEITTAFAVANVFSPYAISQISAGEKSGEMDKTLHNIAENYKSLLDSIVQKILKLIEPAMIIIVALFVAYIAITAYGKYFGYLRGLVSY